MRGLLCSALDAVAKETPAKAATSSSRAARPVNVWGHHASIPRVVNGATEAGVVVLLIPCAILFLALQKYYVKGLYGWSCQGLTDSADSPWLGARWAPNKLQAETRQRRSQY